jgi:hypothetical protein
MASKRSRKDDDQTEKPPDTTAPPTKRSEITEAAPAPTQNRIQIESPYRRENGSEGLEEGKASQIQDLRE